ncbi:retrovirus-related Pol polyprotein from transposon opus [Trichonephila clavipes]|nr:retrovirus-related Pol polyprotein from transposon opus [Trichonephila clavipes]
MCVDFRALNAVTKVPVFPMKDMQELIFIAGPAHWLTSIDLLKGYWQIKMDEESKPLTAFTTHNAVYQWKTMPFGLAGHPVHCDASDYGVGCCLTQQDTEGIYRPIAFASQKFNATQKNWASIEKEAWAVLYGLNKFDKWIYGAKVEIISDHNPLKYLNQTTPKSPKLIRWALALQRWNHSITHRPVVQRIPFVSALSFRALELGHTSVIVPMSIFWLKLKSSAGLYRMQGDCVMFLPLEVHLSKYQRELKVDEAHFWLNGYVNKQNCRIWSEANQQVYVEIPLHPQKLTVWCALWAGGILLQKR